MTYEAKILADSIASGVRLSTMEVTFPRFILAEFNTHRTFCLAGDTELEFDLPAGSPGSERRVHRMRIDEFVDKWLNGARRFAANPKRDYDLSWIEPNRVYAAPHAAAMMGMANASNIHRLCRAGEIEAYRDARTWMITGDALKRWRQSTPEHTRFDMRAKLAGMRIRQLNEDTGDIQWSHVTDVSVSGVKEVYEVVAGDFSVAGSADHLVKTVSGWKRIGDLSRGDLLIVRKFGKRAEDRLDPMRLKKIGGVWRSVWQRIERERMRNESSLCRRCAARDGVEVHHLVPVYQDPSRAFDQTNITLLCERCHGDMHETQDWQGGTYLYGAAVPVEEIRFRGTEPTYDLSIAGAFPNFLANGVVVHNSRNSASSRAIPVEKRIAQVRDNPFVPEAFGKNKSGMQSSEDLLEQNEARAVWLTASMDACKQAEALAKLGVHKQHANRLLEPFCWHTVVVSATEWDNFFALRTHKAAQPEMQITAKLMREAYAASTPRELQVGAWHLPYVEEADYYRDIGDDRTYFDTLVKISVARCAAVSFDRQNVEKPIEAYVERHDQLAKLAHWSPFEHQAQAGDWRYQASQASGVYLGQELKHSFPYKRCGDGFIGNFRAPWLQYRKMFDGEAVWSGE